MFRPLMTVSLLCTSALFSMSASADSLPTRKQLPLSVAMEAAMEAVAVCEKSGYRVTATVMDASGLVKAIAKGDLAPPHTLDSSRGKSYAAVSLGPNFSEPTTSAIVARVSNGPAFGPLQHLPGVFLVPGGVDQIRRRRRRRDRGRRSSGRRQGRSLRPGGCCQDRRPAQIIVRQLDTIPIAGGAGDGATLASETERWSKVAEMSVLKKD
jgi:uncharacterized protein GlcG (DUF336 family)